jgi:hypothetical protein
MAAFLTIDLLRAPAAPMFFHGGELAVRRRPISARGTVGADGRLTCCWDTDTADPPPPPKG